MNDANPPHTRRDRNGHPRTPAATRTGPTTGILEWFPMGDRDHVEQTLADLAALGVQHLRTGISWADWYTPEGGAWYDWLLPRLHRAGLDVLPSVLYTPPTLGIVPKTSSPPRDPKAYADFLDLLVTRYDKYFDTVELWNEPNNRSEYDFTLDEHWHRFSEMVGGAAYWMQRLGKRTVLGGMSPTDPAWLDLMLARGLTPYLDVVGIHAFPDVFDTQWEGWPAKVGSLQPVLQRHGCRAEVWVTEAGFSTWQHDEHRQVRHFCELLAAPVERFYWYALNDLDDSRLTVDGFHLDEREYHFGLRRTAEHQRAPKLLFRLWRDQGVDALPAFLAATEGMPDIRPVTLPGEASIPAPGTPVPGTPAAAKQPGGFHSGAGQPYTLITGGAGFVGTNLAAELLRQGKPVVLYDNLSRPGTEKNLAWLRRTFPEGLRVFVGDIRNAHAVQHAVRGAEAVFHFAAQVAVTTSLLDPREDFDINVVGTQHVLEALRKRTTPAPVVFTSTNKVYGGLDDVGLELRGSHYVPTDQHLRYSGIAEDRPLDFHSPYGCSKGAADQYVLDYARTLGVPGVVFRMSCMYGLHQHGNEDQGWVAHFLIRALHGLPVTVYGDGHQVRDILFVDDLVAAFQLALQHMPRVSGQAFNIGGGVDHTVSVSEVLQLAERLHGPYTAIQTGPWRPGDQRYYVSNADKFRAATGWRPKVGVRDGIERLYRWLLAQQPELAATTLRRAGAPAVAVARTPLN